MTARRGDLKRALCFKLTFDLAEIGSGREVCFFAVSLWRLDLNGYLIVEHLPELDQILCAADLYPVYHSGFTRVLQRHEYPLYTELPRLYHHRQNAVYPADLSAERKLADKRANDFAAPLFNHEMPADARLIQATAAENDDGSTSATIIMQTEWSEQEILDHYNDTTYPPAAENDEITLSVLPLDDSSIEAVKQAGLYEEGGGNYWFVYLYSAPKR